MTVDLRIVRMGFVAAWLGMAGCCAMAAPKAVSATQAMPAKRAGQEPGANAAYSLGKAPSWVAPMNWRDVEGLPVANAPLQVLLLDEQVRHDALQTETYRHIIRRVQDRTSLETAAQWEIEFDPSYQSLLLHTLVVWRDGQRHDRLPASKVQVLQRETQLERQIYDGRRTASLVVDDVRVGDRLELAYTLTGRNPVFEGRFVTQEWSLSGRGPTALARYRLTTPKALEPQLRLDDGLHQVQRSVQGAWVTTVIERRNVPGPVLESNAPAAAYLPDQFQLSAFDDWPAVATWAQGLFRGALVAPLAASVQQQAEALRRSKGEDSVAAVLNFVQNDIRYFGTEIGANSHQPALPEQVLRQRFGDCKDKVGLAVALLRHLGIEATPLLVSTQYREAVSKLLPSPLAFNHAILTVTLDGQTWVLDPTRSQQTGPLAERQSIGLGHGLPARAQAGLMALPSARGAERVQVLDTLHFSSLEQDPELDSAWTYHGEMAEMVRRYAVGEARQEMQKHLAGEYARAYSGAEPVGDLAFEEVSGRNSVTLRQRYRVKNYLRLDDDRLLLGDLQLVELMQALRLPDQTPRKRALQLAMAGRYQQTLRLSFDSPVFARASSQRGEEGDRFVRLNWTQRVEPRLAEITGDLQVAGDDVPADRWQTHRETLQKLWPKMSTTLSIATLSPDANEQVAQKMAKLDEAVRQRKSPYKTATQVQAAQRLLLLEAQLAARRLPAPARARLLGQLVVQLDHLGRADEAQGRMEEALTLAPDNNELLRIAAVNAAQRGDVAQAQRWATRVLQSDPQDTATRMLRARAHYLGAQFSAARDDAREALRQLPPEERGYAQIWLLLSQRRLGEAPDESLRRVESLQVPPWPAPVLDVLTERLSESGARQEALRDGQAASGRLCELYYFMGEARRQAGDDAEARRLLQLALDTGVVEFVEHSLAQQALAELNRRPR